MSRRDDGPERGEVAAEDLRARLGRVVRLGLVDRDESARGTRAPERRLVVVEEVRADARAAPGAGALDPGEPVLALEVRERLRGGHGARARRARAPSGASRSARSDRSGKFVSLSAARRSA